MDASPADNKPSSAYEKKPGLIDRILLSLWIVGYGCLLAAFQLIKKLESFRSFS
jgi:hypothetical protein